jgi:hypothetical protein
MKDVKSTPALKKEFNALRRKLTVKVGQLTKDESNVAQVVSSIDLIVI